MIHRTKLFVRRLAYTPCYGLYVAHQLRKEMVPTSRNLKSKPVHPNGVTPALSAKPLVRS